MQKSTRINTHLRSIIMQRDFPTLRSYKDLEKTGFEDVSMGARPTGRPHLGNLFVMATALHYLRINSSAKVHIDIMDLDFDCQRGQIFTPFVNMPTTPAFREELVASIDLLSKHLNVNASGVKLKFFSKRMAHGEFRETFVKLITDRDSVRALRYSINGQRGRFNLPPISLICSGCGQSNSAFAEFNAYDGTFKSKCSNMNCSVDEYTTKLENGELFNIYYLTDPIRDLFYEGKTLHVFGGDYAKDTGKMRAPRYAYVAAAIETARLFLDIQKEMPTFFVAPLIIDGNGNKISKSAKNYDGGMESDVYAYLKEQTSRVAKILGQFVSGTLDGFQLVAEHH